MFLQHMEGLFDTDLIRILLGSIPHPAHLFPLTDIVHDAAPFPLEMAHCPLSELLYKDHCREWVVKMTKPAVHAKQWMVLIGKKMQSADTLPLSLTSEAAFPLISQHLQICC